MKKAPAKPAGKPHLLAGGNPQIAKADGDAPVQAYIAAMPGWKQDVGRRLDALVTRTVPAVGPHCGRPRPAHRSTTTCATSTSTKANPSTKPGSPTG